MQLLTACDNALRLDNLMQNMGAMRWAQTANAGVLPSDELPNTFLAQAYDLDDPWGPAMGNCFAGRDTWACCEPKYNATSCAGREELCAPACAAAVDTATKVLRARD